MSVSPQVEAALERIAQQPGHVGFYYKDLTDGSSAGFQEYEPIVAASVIKIPILVEFFEQMQEGTLFPDEEFVIRQEDKLPSCGALNYMHTGLHVSALDLATLMIILSDNTATNLLIKRVGMDNVNRRMRMLGCQGITLRRLLFDSEASARGIENTVTAYDIALLLRKMQEGELPYSEKMLQILRNQRLNGKIPFWLHGIPIAHKTGEDDGITHDCGIIYTEKPFIVCFLAEQTDVPAFERCIQEISRDLAESAK